MKYRKPDWLVYQAAQAAAWLLSRFVYGCHVVRNELRGKKGAFVLIANHQSALDFVNLIGLTRRRMSFVISNSFFSTLPVKGLLEKAAVIHKQQFQTTAADLRAMKAVVDAGQPLVIFPAGLMCEDGLSTPIPAATYKFLKWLKADVYAARTTGAYFVMPKWAGGMRPGRTCMDAYKLFDREELAEMSESEISARTQQALMFDAYREQSSPSRYNRDIRGLENVLYLCPHCGAEFTMEVTNGNTIRCTNCGFAEYSDKRGRLHQSGGPGREIPYVSDWSRMINAHIRSQVQGGALTVLQAQTAIHMIDDRKKRFSEVGRGMLRLTAEGFTLQGTLHGVLTELAIPIDGLPTLPVSPGRHLELQQGQNIYRCVLDDGRLAMKFIHMLESLYECR